MQLLDQKVEKILDNFVLLASGEAESRQHLYRISNKINPEVQVIGRRAEQKIS